MTKDYHAYRSYGEDSKRPSGLRGVIGGLIAWARRRLKAALEFGAPRTSSTVLLTRDSVSGFSVLGTHSGLHRPAECPFPIAPATAQPQPRKNS